MRGLLPALAVALAVLVLVSCEGQCPLEPTLQPAEIVRTPTPTPVPTATPNP